MKIKTKFFGEIEIEENKIVNFKEGIPGFEKLKKFVVLNMEENDTLKCLNSTEDGQICLLLISPWDYFKEYEFELTDNDEKELEINSPEDIVVYNVLTIRENRITANLLSPIVINVLKNKGKQIILSNSKYSIRQEIKCLF